MTLIRIDLRDATIGGTTKPKTGFVSFTATMRRHINEAPDYVILPQRVKTYLNKPYIGSGTSGSPQFPASPGVAYVDLAPTVDGVWAWNADEATPRGVERLVYVPDLSGVVEYGDLVEVDPKTLNPLSSVSPVWFTALEGEQAARVAADANLQQQINAGGGGGGGYNDAGIASLITSATSATHLALIPVIDDEIGVITEPAVNLSILFENAIA